MDPILTVTQMYAWPRVDNYKSREICSFILAQFTGKYSKIQTFHRDIFWPQRSFEGHLNCDIPTTPQ